MQQDKKKYTDTELNDWLKNESGISVQGPGTGNLRRDEVVRMMEQSRNKESTQIQNETEEQSELRMLRQKAGITEVPFHKWSPEETLAMQTFLDKNGYYKKPAKLDGIAGPKTQAAYYRYIATKPRIPMQSEPMRNSGVGGKLGDRIINFLKRQK